MAFEVNFAHNSKLAQQDLKKPLIENIEMNKLGGPSMVDSVASNATSPVSSAKDGNTKTGQQESSTQDTPDKKIPVSIEKGEMPSDLKGEKTMVNDFGKDSMFAVSRIRMATSLIETDVIQKVPSAIDIMSYAYFFIGFHKGTIL